MRSLWLGLCVLPYLATVGVDAWFHRSGRHVPRLEQWVHAGLATAMTAFLASVFLGHTRVALMALATFLGLLAFDELAFHRAVTRRERELHVTSWIAFAGFLAIWWLTDIR